MIMRREPRTTSGRIAIEMRFNSSAGARFCHIAFGTVPNIAPPSRRKWRSRIGRSSRSPSCIDGLLQLDEDAVRRRWVDEGDERAVRAGAGRLVDQAHALLFQACQRGA